MCVNIRKARDNWHLNQCFKQLSVAFEKVQANVSSVMSVRPSAWNTTRLPQDRFSYNLVFDTLRKSVENLEVSL
jgi:hypothetical protein